jgi:hypothetical protein
MRNAQTKKANRLIQKRESLRRDIELLQRKRTRSVEEEISLEALRTAYYSVAAKYDQQYPPPDAGIMPTEFGNILKASEAYSGTRYGIDAVQFWPRLWHVIPPTYQQTIDGARNELSFLVNMSALSVLFYLLCFLAILTNVPVPSVANPPDWSLILNNSFRYILAALLAMATNWFFNKAAIYSVGDYGIMIRSAYDFSD